MEVLLPIAVSDKHRAVNLTHRADRARRLSGQRTPDLAAAHRVDQRALTPDQIEDLSRQLAPDWTATGDRLRISQEQLKRVTRRWLSLS